MEDKIIVKVAHDLKRQILEVPSLFRVINNYYYKKNEIQDQIKPLILKKFKESLNAVEKKGDWLFTIPVGLTTLGDDFISKKDSFRFPESIILFESWMNLGLDALFPKYVFQYKFPGFLRGEKSRNVFQFIYATSRGFGFPIYFGPEFYEYRLTIGKILEPIFRWSHEVCHKINQGIVFGNKKFKSKRHHPGEFESVIISEYQNDVYKGIDTLLHGYFTNDPNYLGRFSSLKEALENVTFSYTIGDHAMSVVKKKVDKVLELPLITHEKVIQKYDIDFYSYIKKLLEVDRLLIKKIKKNKLVRRRLIYKLKITDRIIFRFEQSRKKIISKNFSDKFSEIEKYSHYKAVMEKLREILFTTPLYTHTVHLPKKGEETYQIMSSKDEVNDECDDESTNSVLLSYIKYYQNEHNFIFEEFDIINALKELRDKMAKMWLYFRQRQYRYAKKKLNELTTISLEDENYPKKVKEYLDKLIPIISLYEIFDRPLAESVYPESIPQTQRIGAHLARFLTSKYNPIGINIMNLFNQLAFRNWSYFILKKKLTYKEFFFLLLRLPIWKHIPPHIRNRILSYSSQ